MDAVFPGRTISRTISKLPDAREALALLCEANLRAPGGEPVVVRNRDLWLYGAGNLGRLACRHLEAVCQPVAGIIDRNAQAFAGTDAFAGLPVLAPDEVPAAVKEEALLAVSVVTSPFAPLQAELVASGWRTVVPFYDVAETYRDRHPLSNGWFAAAMGTEAMGDAGEVLEGFADDASRAHYLRFAAWRLARQEWDFPKAPVTTGDRFFIPETCSAFQPGERVVDAGAHQGELLPRFWAALDGSAEKFWAIEPDPQSLNALGLAQIGWPSVLRDRVEIVDAVLADCGKKARFHAGLGYASQTAATGSTLRETTTIDALGLDATILKLHLEGGELAALKGGLETVRRNRPIVMLTVYHDAAGLIESPLFLMRELADYGILMRTHAYCGTGAVLYAIPDERVP
ncbi:FkbM family methyltransferase [Jiella endophytica]|uniref:FkbM family methyltransferase n=1 Tax=Jiella endophytica TaxID=2558362 RepID=A0A4Y8RGN5_9HYPH|nr:FkbM family methyltransferase [Jiella endophytica]TFF21818.1 FkbM family methyltransferase [Jiella endophytica]